MNFLFSILNVVFMILGVEPIQKFPKALSKEEELENFLKMKSGDDEARNKLIEHNLRLVAHIIKKYDTAKEEQEDLISVGTIGLIKAIDSFDFSHGTRFATYAGKCVQNEVLMYFRSQKKYAQEANLQDAIEVDKEGNPLTILDVMRVEDDIVEQIDLKNRTSLAMQALKNVLDERERTILCLRFGLNGQAPMTQHKIAEKMGISRSYVSRIEKGALEKIRFCMKKTKQFL